VNTWIVDLEKQVMQMFLEGDYPFRFELNKQYHLSKIVKREVTGVGFFTTFLLPTNTPIIENGKSLHIEDVQAEIEGLKYGVGFVLFIKDGKLEMLEGFSYDEPWPSLERPVQFKVFRKLAKFQ